ncbi:unnamed protein product [Amoebophrya sp. A25]|nr:unnamed protein product [Amoebophrya sp. A25]|eukprot:GSA25T00019614001.1
MASDALRYVLKEWFGTYVTGLERAEPGEFKNLRLKVDDINEDLKECQSPLYFKDGAIGDVSIQVNWLGTVSFSIERISFEVGIDAVQAMRNAMGAGSQEAEDDAAAAKREEEAKKMLYYGKQNAKTAYFCPKHDSSDRRMKGISKTMTCEYCKSRLQTNYVDFVCCPPCSQKLQKCMICGDTGCDATSTRSTAPVAVNANGSAPLGSGVNTNAGVSDRSVAPASVTAKIAKRGIQSSVAATASDDFAGREVAERIFGKLGHLGRDAQSADSASTRAQTSEEEVGVDAWRRLAQERNLIQRRNNMMAAPSAGTLAHTAEQSRSSNGGDVFGVWWSALFENINSSIAAAASSTTGGDVAPASSDPPSSSASDFSRLQTGSSSSSSSGSKVGASYGGGTGLNFSGLDPSTSLPSSEPNQQQSSAYPFLPSSATSSMHANMSFHAVTPSVAADLPSFAQTPRREKLDEFSCSSATSDRRSDSKQLATAAGDVTSPATTARAGGLSSYPGVAAVAESHRPLSSPAPDFGASADAYLKSFYSSLGTSSSSDARNHQSNGSTSLGPQASGSTSRDPATSNVVGVPGSASCALTTQPDTFAEEDRAAALLQISGGQTFERKTHHDGSYAAAIDRALKRSSAGGGGNSVSISSPTEGQQAPERQQGDSGGAPAADTALNYRRSGTRPRTKSGEKASGWRSFGSWASGWGS